MVTAIVTTEDVGGDKMGRDSEEGGPHVPVSPGCGGGGGFVGVTTVVHARPQTGQ